MNRYALNLVLGVLLVTGAIPTQAQGTGGTATASRGSPLVLVAGASGQTGRLVLEHAAREGYRVRAMAREPGKWQRDIAGRYEWVAADVRDAATLVRAMAGVDYVVCAIGATERSGPNGPEFVDYGGVKNLADAARAAGIRQFVLVSSHGAGGGGGASGWLLNKVLMPGILEWKGKGEQYLRASGVPYTILRPGGLTSEPGGRAGIRFTQGDSLGGGTIPRADVALLAIYALGNPDATGKTFEVASDETAPVAAWKSALAGLQKD